MHFQEVLSRIFNNASAAHIRRTKTTLVRFWKQSLTKSSHKRATAPEKCRNVTSVIKTDGSMEIDSEKTSYTAIRFRERKRSINAPVCRVAAANKFIII